MTMQDDVRNTGLDEAGSNQLEKAAREYRDEYDVPVFQPNGLYRNVAAFAEGQLREERERERGKDHFFQEEAERLKQEYDYLLGQLREAEQRLQAEVNRSEKISDGLRKDFEQKCEELSAARQLVKTFVRTKANLQKRAEQAEQRISELEQELPCGHPAANLETLNLGSGETDQYCNFCLQLRNVTGELREQAEQRWEECAKIAEERIIPSGGRSAFEKTLREIAAAIRERAQQ